MRTAREVTPEKLRGGFYTPPDLVHVCLERAAENAPRGRNLRLLEPSVGDGAFIRCLPASSLSNRVDEVFGIEVLEIEAERARHALRSSGIGGEVLAGSAVDWAASNEHGEFDLAVGNPPFVRFQFVSPRDRSAAERLAAKLELGMRRVSNLWIPVLLGALSRLRLGGASRSSCRPSVSQDAQRRSPATGCCAMSSACTSICSRPAPSPACCRRSLS